MNSSLIGATECSLNHNHRSRGDLVWHDLRTFAVGHCRITSIL